MFIQALKVSFRTLTKYKFYTSLNILGLALGMSAVLFIALFVLNEIDYDHFFSKGELIYRIGISGNISGKHLDGAVSPAPLASTILHEIPQARETVRLLPFNGLVETVNGTWIEGNIMYADISFFRIFDFRFIAGNPENAFLRPYDVLISEEMARKVFGNINPMGKTLRFESDTNNYIITGVVSVPQNIHFRFDCLASITSLTGIDQQNWLINCLYTYVLTDPGYTISHLQNDLQSKIFHPYLVPQVEMMTGQPIAKFLKSGNSFQYIAQHLYDIHLHSSLSYELGNTIKSSYLMIFIIAVISLLVIATINFMNLATAQSVTRAKETGLRKLFGSSRKRLVLQFLLESIFQTFIALIFALVIFELLFEPFRQLLVKSLDLYLVITWKFYLFASLLPICTGFLAGIYPAFVMSAYHPIHILKKDFRYNKRAQFFRNTLVILQFAASIIIILFTLIQYRQLNYMKKHHLGFDKEQVIVLKHSQALKLHLNEFRNELLKYNQIASVSYATHIPGELFINNAFFTNLDSGATYMLNQSIVSPDFAKTLNLHMQEGRFFDPAVPSDSFACILNKTAVKFLGLKNPIGKKIYQPLLQGRISFKIIGVVDDFNFKSLQHPIEPLVLTSMNDRFDGYILAQIKPCNADSTLHYMESVWKSYSLNYPFEYFWLNDDYNKQYKTENLTAFLLLCFSSISLFIASLGLLGLIAFSTLQRLREIGIRKTIGASSGSIVMMLTQNIIYQVSISLLIAFPLAYIFIQKWLSGFYYHISMQASDFIIASLLAVSIALLTVIFQALRAARTQPSESVKYE